MKYTYQQQIYIKKGFYRGYRGKILEYKEVSTKEQENQLITIETQYKIIIEGVPIKDYWISEKEIVPYKKYIIF